MEKEKELDFDCTHCEHYYCEHSHNFCLQKKEELSKLEPCVKFELKQTHPNEFFGLITALMFSFMQPVRTPQPISEEKTAKAKELAKVAKAQMDKGGKFEIREGTELYEDTELFNAYCSELSKLITIDSLNRETAKVAEIKRMNSYIKELPKE